MTDVLIGLFADLSVVRAVSLAVGVFGASLVPWFLLVDNRALQPWLARWAAASREAFRDVAALLLLLTTRPKGAMA